MIMYEFNTICDATRLKAEIIAAAITVSIDHIETVSNPEQTLIFFNSSLTDADYVKLKNVVEKHKKPIPDSINISSFSTYQPAFGSKVLPDGKKLFRRVRGVSSSVSTGSNNIDFTIPYSICKITGLQILNANLGDKANFQVLDTAAGTLTGDPFHILNEFGQDVYIKPDNAEYPSRYDADLFAGLVLRLVFTSTSEKTIYVNFDLHEVI